MIGFQYMSDELPYLIFKKKYDNALSKNQKNIEVMSISSFNKNNNEVDSRFVNLKFVKGNQFIFFSNYNSPKSIAFTSHNQISACLYWPSLDVQIRMKAKIKKTSTAYNQKYFFDRSEKKNALAISSNQSKPTDSYNQVKLNYNNSLKNDDLKNCPEFWGGYSFVPYYFEFWEGHESRLNKRESYAKSDDSWKYLILQP